MSMAEKQKGNSIFKGIPVHVFKWALILFCSIAFITLGIAFGTFFIGQKLDFHFGTHPWITLVLGLIGMMIILGATLFIALKSAKEIREIMNSKKK